jgi:hypothetical protein
MKITHILVATLTTLVLIGCSTPSTLKYDKSNLTLNVNNKYLQVQGSVLKSKRENFGILYLDQKLIKIADGSLLMYEYGEADMDYEFANITTRTLQIVFDTQKIINVYEESLFFAYQLVLADGRVLNLVVTQGYDQEITMVYGMSSKQLDKMIKKLNLQVKPVPYRNVINLSKEANPLLSRWTTWKVHIVPLVQPLPRRMGM